MRSQSENIPLGRKDVHRTRMNERKMNLISFLYALERQSMRCNPKVNRGWRPELCIFFTSISKAKKCFRVDLPKKAEQFRMNMYRSEAFMYPRQFTRVASVC